MFHVESEEIVVAHKFTVIDDLVDFSLTHEYTHGLHDMLENMHDYFTVVVGVGYFECINEILQCFLVPASLLKNLI